MKKTLLTISSIALLVAPVATVISCGKGPQFTIISKDKNPELQPNASKITGKSLAAVVSDPENPRWQKAKDSILVNGKAAGFDTKVDIKKSVTDQSSWLSNQQSADAWIVGATDSTVAGAWQNRNKSKPVVAYDRLVRTPNRTAYNWYVTYDNSLVGWYQGASILGSLYNYDFIDDSTVKSAITLTAKTNAITTLINNSSKVTKLTSEKIVLALGGGPADNNAGLFYSGGMELIKAAHNVDSHLTIPASVDTFSEVANDKWDYSKGQTKLDTIIKGLKKDDKSKIAAVLSPNDGMAKASINAIKNNSLNPLDIYITGQDSNNEAIISISQDTGQNMTIFKPDTKASAVAVALAAKLVSDDTFNVAPGSSGKTDSNGYTSMTSYIQSLFKDLHFTISGNQYFTDNKSAGTTNHAINTILLSPEIIDKNNINTFFKITKNY